MWEPGRTQLAAADVEKLNRATTALARMRLVLAVYANAGSKAPVAATARDQFCTYVRNTLSRYASINDVVIWNEPNKNQFWSPQAGAAEGYEALLARCWDVLHAARLGVNVIGLALAPRGFDDAGSTSAGEFIRRVGQAYRGTGRTKPILDTVAHHVYGADAAERPWRKHIESKVLSGGDWNKLMYNLWLAFDGTAQPIPGGCGTGGCVSIWYLEGGVQTAVDPGHASAYSGTENVAVLVPDFAGGESGMPAETSPAPDQYTQVLDAARLAACQPHVGAYFNFLVFDEPVLVGWQSGAYWADRTPKDSLPAFRQVIGETNARAVDCDGLKGGRPSPDFMPPVPPENLQAAAAENPFRVELSWSPSSDDASPVGYRVYRNGAHVGSTSSTTWTNGAVERQVTYTYTVRAIDAAGNLGGASAPVTVTTPPEPGSSLVLQPVEDAYVRSNHPNENTGADTTLRVYRSGSTETHSYLKFVVPGEGAVTQATLRLYVTRSSSAGGTVYASSSSSWSEATLTWQSKPRATGSLLAPAAAVTAGTWVELDVSALVSGPGTYSVVLKDGGAAAWYSSSEGAQPPQLVVTSAGGGTANVAPVATADAYATSAGTPLSVAAPGVLANDEDPDGDPLSASAASAPAHGTLDLRSNGSYTYTPDAGFTGEDAFSYRPSDGTAEGSAATVTISVLADTSGATFTPVDDAFVRSNYPAENTGSDPTVRVYKSGSTETHSYLKFVVSGVGAVTQARLRLYVTRSSPAGGTVYPSSSSSWSEATLTWQSKPSATGPALASAGAATAGRWVEVDVSALVRGPGTYSFVLKDGGSPAWYSSREGAQAPQLVTG